MITFIPHTTTVRRRRSTWMASARSKSGRHGYECGHGSPHLRHAYTVTYINASTEFILMGYTETFANVTATGTLVSLVHRPLPVPSRSMVAAAGTGRIPVLRHCKAPDTAGQNYRIKHDDSARDHGRHHGATQRVADCGDTRYNTTLSGSNTGTARPGLCWARRPQCSG